MKQSTITIITLVCIGLASLNFVPRLLHAAQINMSSQEAIQEGTRLGNTIIQSKHPDFWINGFMWRFSTLPSRTQTIIKAYAAKRVGEYYLKQSNAIIDAMNNENRENTVNRQRYTPMEMG